MRSGNCEGDAGDEAANVFDAGERRQCREEGVFGLLACNQPALFAPHHSSIGDLPDFIAEGDGGVSEGWTAIDFLRGRCEGGEGMEHVGLRWCEWLGVSD